jgi:hypothetical protein
VALAGSSADIEAGRQQPDSERDRSVEGEGQRQRPHEAQAWEEGIGVDGGDVVAAG